MTKKKGYKTFRQIYRVFEGSPEEGVEEGGLQPRLEIEIFPYRFPSDETITKFLLKVRDVKGITQITMQGPQIYYGKKIKIAGKIIPLKIQVAKFWIEIEKTDVMGKLNDICNETFPYGYSVRVGRFTKKFGGGLGGRTLVIRTDFLEDEE